MIYITLSVLLLKIQRRVKPQKPGSHIVVEATGKNEIKQHKRKHLLLIIRS